MFGTKKAIKIIFDYLAVKDELRKSDAIFLVGGSSLLPCKKVAELYKKGYAKYIFSTTKGGVFSNKDYENAGGEGLFFKKELIRLGIPESAIFIKNEAMNTLDEIKMSVPFMNENNITPKSLILVDRPVYQRRELATFQKHYPDIKFINCPSDEKIIYDQETLTRVVQEINRLILYGVKGDLKVQDMPKDVISSWSYLYPYAKII